MILKQSLGWHGTRGADLTESELSAQLQWQPTRLPLHSRFFYKEGAQARIRKLTQSVLRQYHGYGGILLPKGLVSPPTIFRNIVRRIWSWALS